MSSHIQPEFVLFGDSLTEWSFDEDTLGFGLHLRQQYEEKVNVLNEGQAGYTSSALKRDFDRIIARSTTPGAAPTLLFTIFLGANDACIIGSSEYVPWPKFETNIREFIETILTQDAMANTKIVVIAPPPIACPSPAFDESLSQEEIDDTIEYRKGAPRYKTYMSKKRYAEGLMRIASEYEETGRVVGLNFWQGIVNAALEEAGAEYDEELPPGCGLPGALSFNKGWFTDGLHLNVKGYNVLSKALVATVTEKWPELAPERI